MKKNLLLLFSFFSIGISTKAQVTWASDIAPILYNNCTSCHHTGGMAPNSLMTYSETFNWRFMIQSYVNNGSMPPWPPNANYTHLAGERRLSDGDKQKISNWVLGGAPEGNPASAPTMPTYATNGSQLSTINYSAKMPDYNVNTTSDLYRCFVINTNFANDVFANEIEIKPGNTSIVHHVLIYEDTANVIKIKDSADVGAGYTSFFGTGNTDSRLVGEWVPGTSPIKFPAGMGIRLKKNTRLILQIHYPAGTFNKLDSTRVNIKYSTPNPREVYFLPFITETNLKNGPLVIPPNVIKTFTASATPAIPIDFSLLAVGPHMHLIGKNMRVFVKPPLNADTIKLIDIPKWDFRWQGVYNFRNPIRIPATSTIITTSAYDNTAANPANPNNPPQQVVQGESTTNEMMMVFFAFTVYFPGDENIVIDNSPIIGIKENSNEKLMSINKIYPNPANKTTSLNYTALKSEKAKMKIYTIDGRLISDTQQNILSGDNSIEINTSEFATGSYIVELKGNNFSSKAKLIVER